MVNFIYSLAFGLYLPRALMRGQHLYILLSALIHMSLGSYFRCSTNRSKQYLQVTGSTLIVLSTGILIYSFFVELPSDSMERPLCRMGLYLILAGTLFHSIPNLFSRNKNNNIEN